MNTNNAVDGVGTIAMSAGGAAATELNNLSADVEDLLGKLATATGIDLDDLRERIRDKAAAAGSALAAGGRQVAQSTRAAAMATDGFVRGSPWQAVGLAAMAGVGVGYVLSRR